MEGGHESYEWSTDSDDARKEAVDCLSRNIEARRMLEYGRDGQERISNCV